MKLGKYSFGIGDRFGQAGLAQLRAMQKAQEQGVAITPVWNKSFREHGIIGSSPDDVRAEADAAVKLGGWRGDYFVDADHINLNNVDGFVGASDFFTLDVAEYIGAPSPTESIDAFVDKYGKYAGRFDIAGLAEPITVTPEIIRATAEKYLHAVQQAAQTYRHIKDKKSCSFVVEVSMDETDIPQTPVEMLFILAAIADEDIPAQTIAPRFSGRFNKGVDYVGDVEQFAAEFAADIAVIQFAVKEFGLPDNLKLSVHSGSDKFAIYPAVKAAMVRFDTGVHVKTAGTTWLEEVAALALSGEAGLKAVQDIYAQALAKIDALCKPYASVIDIDPAQLPDADTVKGWTGAQFAAALQHEPDEQAYNPNLRQLIHVGYKVAADMGASYISLLQENYDFIADYVTGNLFDRHIKRIFLP